LLEIESAPAGNGTRLAVVVNQAADPRRARNEGEPVLRDALLLSYCAAVGFVAAGVAASFYKLMTQEPAQFRMLGKGWGAAVTTFFFCAVTGPAIIFDLILKSRFVDRGASTTFLVGLAVALIWSICSGILVLELVLTVRNGLA
jgi:hypothetical protein